MSAVCLGFGGGACAAADDSIMMGVLSWEVVWVPVVVGVFLVVVVTAVVVIW